MVDISGSENFGTKNQLKSEIVTEIAATMAFSATQNNDKIGLILFSDQIELYIPPKKGKSHILRIIRDLIEFKPENKKTDLEQQLANLKLLQDNNYQNKINYQKQINELYQELGERQDNSFIAER